MLITVGWYDGNLHHGLLLPPVPGAGQQPGSGTQTVLEEKEPNRTKSGLPLTDEVCVCVCVVVILQFWSFYNKTSLIDPRNVHISIYNLGFPSQVRCVSIVCCLLWSSTVSVFNRDPRISIYNKHCMYFNLC